MPNIKSAKKRVLIGEVRNARNKATKSDLKTAIKKRRLPLKAIAPRPMALTRSRSRRSIRLSLRAFCTRTRLLTARAL